MLKRKTMLTASGFTVKAAMKNSVVSVCVSQRVNQLCSCCVVLFNTTICATQQLFAVVCTCLYLCPDACKQIVAGLQVCCYRQLRGYISSLSDTLKKRPCFGEYVVKGGLCLHSQQFFNGWIGTSAVRLLRLLSFSNVDCPFLAALMSSFLVIWAQTALLHPSPQINGPVWWIEAAAQLWWQQ